MMELPVEALKAAAPGGSWLSRRLAACGASGRLQVPFGVRCPAVARRLRARTLSFARGLPPVGPSNASKANIGQEQIG